MRIDELMEQFNKHEANELVFDGLCCDCGKEVGVRAQLNALTEEVGVSGGALYRTAEGEISKETVKLKCPECYEKSPSIRRECEVFSRVSGYLRPVSSWNKGKQQEFKERKPFKIKAGTGALRHD